MWKWHLVLFGMVLSPVSVSAQTPASAEEIRSAIVGKKVEWGTDGVAEYKNDGSYEYYSMTRRQAAQGKYSIASGQLCVELSNRTRCDKIMKDSGGLYMINSKGTEYRAKVQ